LEHTFCFYIIEKCFSLKKNKNKKRSFDMQLALGYF